MQTKLNKTELDVLRKGLPEGAIHIISEKTGLKESSVRQILLKPERFNKKVISLAVSMAMKENQDIDQIKNNINSLVS